MGNLGPTIWLNGQIAGSWASTPSGIRTRLLKDEGSDARAEIDAAAERLEQQLSRLVVTPRYAPQPSGIFCVQGDSRWEPDRRERLPLRIA